ncbi:MAG: hypothetical protein ACPGSM_20940, partial [Thiolinea sp.]
VFYLVASVSLIVVVSMFIFIWQPIWTSGFKDFHTISNAIDNLDGTIRPASETAPQLLAEVAAMNQSMLEIRTAMNEMQQIRQSMVAMQISMKNLEAMNPSILKMSSDMEYMTWAMTHQMARMSAEVDQVGNKFSPFAMLPFNW